VASAHIIGRVIGVRSYCNVVSAAGIF